MDDILTEMQEVLHQVEEELTSILKQGLTASITIHCGPTQYIIEVNRKRSNERKAKPTNPPAPGWKPKR